MIWAMPERVILEGFIVAVCTPTMYRQSVIARSRPGKSSKARVGKKASELVLAGFWFEIADGVQY